MTDVQLHDTSAWVAVALLAFVVALGVVKVLSYVAPSAGVFSVLNAVHRIQLPAAAAIATVTSLGSLYFSEHFMWNPCRFCWFQRIFMYSSAVVLIVAALRRDRGVKWYVGPLAGIGILISSYHILLEHGVFNESKSCAAGGASCAVPLRISIGGTTDRLGPADWYSVTLATMAFIAFAGILALLFLPEPLDTTDDTPSPTPSPTEEHHGEPAAG